MQLRRLTPGHAAEYRAIMLQAYASEPDAFTSTVAEREPLPLDWWASRISDQSILPALVVGAFVGARLVGVAGLTFERRERTKHKATLFGVYVLPEFRGQGIARALVEAALAHARSTPGTQVVQLTVTQSNTPAVQLYESCGFASFGIEPLAVKVGERFVSKVHMWCAVGPADT
jgi:ribosomal protein S18 acetylase RimI-like enzyme